MKILFCSPFLDSPNVVRGGINTWGKYIVEYCRNNRIQDVDFIPFSTDRHVLITETTGLIPRIYLGLRDYLKEIISFTKCVRTNSPDVIHFCTSGDISIVELPFILIIAKLYHAKIALHLHFGRIPALIASKNINWFFLKFCMKHCDSLISMNLPTYNALVNNGFANVYNIPNPIGSDVINYISLNEQNFKHIPRRLLFVGHVYQSKGVFELVKACKKVDNVELIIIGKYTLDIKKELENIACGDWLNFLGEIDHEHVLNELLSSGLFVFPSYTEGFPNVILESMACGCPIVSSNVGAIPEMLDIDNVPCGITFNPKNVDAVFQSIITMLDDESLMAQYSQRAKLRVNSLYTIPVVWKQLCDIWMKC